MEPQGTIRHLPVNLHRGCENANGCNVRPVGKIIRVQDKIADASTALGEGMQLEQMPRSILQQL